jgi:hypothetical protein
VQPAEGEGEGEAAARPEEAEAAKPGEAEAAAEVEGAEEVAAWTGADVGPRRPGSAEGFRPRREPSCSSGR